MRRRIDLEALVRFRQRHSYAETLDRFGLKPQRFLQLSKDALLEQLVDDAGFEALLTIEKPTLQDYYQEVRDGERKQLPPGTLQCRQNNATLVEIVLETIPAYKSADRHGKIHLIRAHVINYVSPTGPQNGAQQFFYDNGLEGMLTKSPHLRKTNSPIAAMELYDREREVGLFDRTQHDYLGQWEIKENGMWQGKTGKELTIEAIEDTLWKIPTYRTANRNERLRLIRTHVINYISPTEPQNGAVQFFYNHGLAGMLTGSPHLRKTGSPIAAIELYDRSRNQHLFDNSYPDHIRDEELARGHLIVPTG